MNDVESYLAALSPEKRATLDSVRAAISAALPGATEEIRYGMPTFVQGKAVAGYAASADHCSYHPMSGHVIAAMATDLRQFATSKGTIRFPVGMPLPADLIAKLVAARLAEIQS
jgi:uncharacterized protein YdhG (YjbR/CyaY superfamily)